MDVSVILRWWILNKNNNTSRFQQQTWSFHPGQHVTSSLWNSAEEAWHYNASGFQPESRICQQTWGHHMAVQQFGQFRAVHRQEFKARRLRSQCRWIAIDMKNCEAGPQYFPSKLLLGAYWQRHHHISCHRTRGCNYFLGPSSRTTIQENENITLIGRMYIYVCIFVYISYELWV